MAATETVTTRDSPTVAPARRIDRIRFWKILAVIVAVGLVVRVVYIFWLRQQGEFLMGDSLVYHRESQLIADGVGWVQPAAYDAFGIKSELAMHPPAYPLWLAMWSWMGFTSLLSHQLLTVPIGLASICTCALVGRQLWTPAAGLIAAGIAAIHPSFFSWEGMVLQEPMAILASTLIVLAFVRLHRNQDWQSVVLAGLAAGFAPLTRAELGVAVAVAAIVVLVSHRSWKMLRSLVCVTLIAVLMVAPWSIHNTRRFGHFVPISNGFGITLATTYCSDLTTDMIGYWSFDCSQRALREVLDDLRAEHPDAVALAEGQTKWIEIAGVPLFTDGSGYYAEWNEAEVDSRLRERSIDFVKENPGYVVKSVPARLGRVLGVFRPLQQIRLDEVADVRQREIAVGAWTGYYLLLPFVLVGGVALWRRSRTQLLLLSAPFIGGLTAIALTFGNTRYRAVGEAPMAVAAAIGLTIVIAWLRATWSQPEPDPEPAVQSSTGIGSAESFSSASTR